MNYIDMFSPGYIREETLQNRHSAFCTLLTFLGLLGAHSANWRPSCRQCCWQTLHLQGRFCLHKMSAMLNLCCQVGSYYKTAPIMTAFSLCNIICESTFLGSWSGNQPKQLLKLTFYNWGPQDKTIHVLHTEGGWGWRKFTGPLNEFLEFLTFDSKNISAKAFPQCP